MLRSMYSGISGMKVNQTKLDVTGNNIANVGTTSFKGSRVTFTDMLSQTSASATSSSLNKGGTNAKQVGLGVQLSSIDRVMTQGMMQSTGRALDVAIDGDGFFMVSKGPVINGDGTLEVSHTAGYHGITDQSLATAGSELMYTRDGSFVLDEQGNLLTADGYRVMGYSLTNDDSSQLATGLNPNSVNTAGLDFKFGPGSQLNGYKVVLGNIGPGTITSADINKVDKTIVVNGDFATEGALTSAQVESAINKALSAAGISQQVTVNGKPMTFSGLGSDSITGGADATSPKTVTLMGMNFSFGEGDQLNDYVIKVGKVNQPKVGATIDSNEKTIIVDADFLDPYTGMSEDIASAINTALKGAGITQEVKGTGITSQLTGLKGVSDSNGTDPKLPSNIVDNGTTIMSFAFNTTPNNEKGAQLNGYSFEFKRDDTLGAPVAKVDKGSKTITVGFNGTPNVDEAAIRTAINTELSNKGLEDVKVASLDQATLANIADGSKAAYKVGSTGVDLAAPKDVTIAGFTIKLPKGTNYNDVEIKIVDLDGAVPPTITPKMNGTKITAIEISGDFREQNVDAATLEAALRTALNNNEIAVSGSPKAIAGVSSNPISGGQAYKAPTSVSVFGLNFDFGDGESLNGYKINVGTITAGTQTSVKVDAKAKTITLNGDFVTAGAVTTASLKNALSLALQDAGIEQNVKVSGTPQALTSGTVSEIANGGTPVQSIGTDGEINFVDGTADLKSYDSSLKTLKIPDKVRIPGTDTELRVKSYTIDSQGVINGILEDGRVAALGQIAMASFKNPEGLTSLGGNLYGASANSGDAVIKSGIGTLGDDNSAGYGDNLQSMLEMSNVDLAEQFTDMIVTTKAFQAAGKMITTGDEILQDIINLKR